MKIIYEPMFLRRIRAFPASVQNEIFEKVSLFEERKNHQALRVHKLKGRLKGCYSFSVTSSIRIVFCYGDEKPKDVHLLTVGDHDVYDR